MKFWSNLEWLFLHFISTWIWILIFQKFSWQGWETWNCSLALAKKLPGNGIIYQFFFPYSLLRSVSIVLMVRTCQLIHCSHSRMLWKENWLISRNLNPEEFCCRNCCYIKFTEFEFQNILTYFYFSQRKVFQYCSFSQV